MRIQSAVREGIAGVFFLLWRGQGRAIPAAAGAPMWRKGFEKDYAVGSAVAQYRCGRLSGFVAVCEIGVNRQGRNA